MLMSQHRFTTYKSMRTDLWESHNGILIFRFLLLKFEQRNLTVAVSSCERGYVRKRSSCGCRCFLIRIKKMRLQKYLDAYGRGLIHKVQYK